MSDSDSFRTRCRAPQWMGLNAEEVQVQVQDPVLQQPEIPSALATLTEAPPWTAEEEAEWPYCKCGYLKHPDSECVLSTFTLDMNTVRQQMYDELQRQDWIPFGFPLPETNPRTLDTTEGRVIPTGLNISYRDQPCGKCTSHFHSDKDCELIHQYHMDTEDLVRRAWFNDLPSHHSSSETETQDTPKTEILSPASPPIGSSLRPIILDSDSEREEHDLEEEYNIEGDYDDLTVELTKDSGWETSKPSEMAAIPSETTWNEMLVNPSCNQCESVRHDILGCPFANYRSESSSSSSSTSDARIGAKRPAQSSRSKYCYDCRTSGHSTRNCQARLDNVICHTCGQPGHITKDCLKNAKRLREKQYGNGHNGGNGPSNGPHGNGHNQQPPHGGSQAMSAK